MGLLRPTSQIAVGTGVGDLVVLVDAGGGTPGLPAISGALLTGVPGSVFGQDYQSCASAEAVQTTGSFTPVVANTFAPTGGPFTGTYRLDVYAEIGNTLAGGYWAVEVRRTDVGPTQLAENINNANADANGFVSFRPIVADFVLAGMMPMFDVRYYAPPGSVPFDAAAIRRIRWQWFRVG